MLSLWFSCNLLLNLMVATLITLRGPQFSLSYSTLSLQCEMQTFLGLLTHIDIEVSMSIMVTYQSTENTLCVCTCIYVAQNLNYGNYFIIMIHVTPA